MLDALDSIPWWVWLPLGVVIGAGLRPAAEWLVDLALSAVAVTADVVSDFARVLLRIAAALLIIAVLLTGLAAIAPA